MRDFDPGSMPETVPETAPAASLPIPAETGPLPYAVSDALPLHALGLAPPPPEIGPHLLAASPIEVALAAAVATAEDMAVAWPPVEHEAEPNSEIDQSAALASAPPTDQDDGGETVPVHAVDVETVQVENGRADVPLLAASETQQESAAGDAAGTVSTQDVNGATPEPEHADMPKAAPSKSEALASLDLSRRTEPPPGSAPPALPPKPTLSSIAPELPRVVAQSAAAAQSRAASAAARPRPKPAFFEAASWPGFLTGLVVALVIGAGIYASLVAG